ncbi:MAG: TolC family protein [Gammaproteobacteria bacterium]|nr:TolC family protein [Gammaproteobacteria bacterium]
MQAGRNLVIATAALISGCLSLEDRPADPVFPADAAFTLDLPVLGTTAANSADWWQRATEGPVLAQLQQALETNVRLRQAEAEVAAARAQRDQARADRGPDVTASADLGVSKTSGSDPTNSRGIGIDADLPLDVGGALALREEAALNLWKARREEARQLRSDIARNFLLAVVDGAEATARDQLLSQQIEASQTLLRLIELRFTQGLASSVDVLQQRDELASLRQQIPLAQRDLRTAQNRLRELSGRTPDATVGVLFDGMPAIATAFAPATPLELLQRRPDLLALQARLAAADARFAAALADRLPTLSLSGRAVTRVASGDVTTLIGAVLDAAFTVFDSGGKEAIAEEQRARLAAAGHDYLATWIERVIEIDDLANDEASLRERIGLSGQRLETAEALLQAARRRYERGVSDYLPVLAALRGLQQQQRDHLSLRADLGRTRIRLHDGLGTPQRETG